VICPCQYPTKKTGTSPTVATAALGTTGDVLALRVGLVVASAAILVAVDASGVGLGIGAGVAVRTDIAWETCCVIACGFFGSVESPLRAKRTPISATTTVVREATTAMASC
jgi:hypothetical protein